MPKPSDPIFSTNHNAALAAFEAISTGQTWGTFDVLKPDAVKGKATRYVVMLWNYHRDDPNGKPDPASKGLLQDPHDGTFWYQFRRCAPGEENAKLAAQWDSLALCQRQRIPIIGILKDRVSGLCALDLTFDGGSFLGSFDDDHLWMQLLPRAGVHSELLTRHSVRASDSLQAAKLARQGKALDDNDYFSPANLIDARARVLREVVQRRGQPAFRKALLAAYGGRCAVTGCDAEDALEAAHIIGYLGPETQRVTNGLLLRADIHTLFDLDLVSICPERLQVVLAPALRVSTYAELHGRSLSLPSAPEQQPDRAALRHRWTGSGQSKASS